MKSAAAGIAAILALIGTPALAADMGLPVKAPLAPPPVPVLNWTGCYINGGAGYGMWTQDHYLTEDGSPYVGDPSTTSGGRGWLGVVGGGCDVQWNNFVVGALVDYDFMDIHGSFSDPAFGFFSATEKESSAWAVGGRIGYLVTPAILTYFNGGYTQSRFNGFTLVSSTSSGFYSFPSQTYNGGFLGGGTEIALSGFFGVPLPPGLFWRSEYRYSSFSCANLPLSVDGLPPTVYGLHSCKDVQTITSSLIWKFNWTGR
jgi:outer membrane immunogenic protein